MDSNFWIFLCFGQSNMAGQAPIEEQDLAVSERFLSMATTDGADRKLGTWRKAVPIPPSKTLLTAIRTRMSSLPRAACPVTTISISVARATGFWAVIMHNAIWRLPIHN